MKNKIGKAIVVGAGISGIRSALDLAEIGYGVTLIDREPHIGGILSQLDYQFPTDRCGMCKMLPLINRDAASQYCLRKGLFHENIDIYLSTELTSIEGEPGNFKVTLRQKPESVNPDLCVGCGECSEVCPVEIPDTFNEKMAKRKAIYLPVPHTIPNTYTIDFASCTRCGACVGVCPTGAILLPKEERKNFWILVVDDELIVRDSLKEWLEDEGFSVDMAGSGQDALALLSKQSYHLMLIDIKMPGMDGMEVLKHAKKDFPDLCVVMMTAYATVETAIEAMKVGALDYLLKPFDPLVFISKILQLYQALEVSRERQLEVGAVVFSGGASYFNPTSGKNTYGYGIYSNVLTSLEFERLISGTGPSQGELLRPSDGMPVKKIAWLLCVGSRDLQTNADFCSSICCMYAIKEARLAKEKSGGNVEPTIFYMDMRTFEKSFQRYRDQAEKDLGINFKRGRIHSIEEDKANNNLKIYYVDLTGECHEEHFDMVVLSVGQRPSPGTEAFAKNVEIPLNQWGFCQPEPFSFTLTNREGIVLGGSFSGLTDISGSIIQASSAALCASRVIHSSGGSLALKPESTIAYRDVSKEMPKVLMAICTCGETFSEIFDAHQLVKHFKADTVVSEVILIEKVCIDEGWKAISEYLKKSGSNRLVIGACLPYVYAKKIYELSQQTGLGPSLIDIVDIRTPIVSMSEKKSMFNMAQRIMKMGLARIKYADPGPIPSVKVTQRALVIGGGIAGMTAALSIADHGFYVDLLEKEDRLGGNLNWLTDTLEGNDLKILLEEKLATVEKHPLISIHTKARVVNTCGQAGHFTTTVKKDEEEKLYTLEHGVIILSTGGTEATTTSYGYGTYDSIITQKELEIKLSEKTIDPKKLISVTMIQCVDSREEPRNYCSRICCATTLKNALRFKTMNPDIAVYVLYRDMMAYGFSESYYTKAREAGIVFIPYRVDKKPTVSVEGKTIKIEAFEPIIGRKVEIESDLLVLATGIIPTVPKGLAENLGIEIDQDGFFQEADSKWRPVDSLKEGIFACGLTYSPRNVTESIATAEAAAQRALRILCNEQVVAGKVVAQVRHSYCSLCERCIDVCPYKARTVDPDLEKVIVNPVMCQGCGSCAAVCPNSASVLKGFSDQQMLDVIDMALEGVAG